MRPIKLKISAFGPFVKPVELDFEKGLKGEKLFLIHGATGAGKTTILDAICYALYDESSGKERNILNFRSEQATQNDKTFVEFTFALREKIYKIIRCPGYDMPRGIANVTKFAELYENGELQTSDWRETNKKIKNLLTFNAEQFRQVVMLPQGKFRDFLMADSSKRSDILNVIFNSTFYEKIEEGLKEKSKIAEEKFNDLSATKEKLSAEIKEIGTVEEVEKNLQQAKKSVENLKLQSDTAQKNLTAGEMLNKDFERFDLAEKKLKISQSELEKILSEYTPAKKEFEKRKAEQSQLQEVINKFNELKKISQYLKEFQAKQKELTDAEKSEKFAKEEISKLDKSIVKCENELEKIKKQTEELQDADLKFKDAEQLLKSAKNKQDRQKELERLRKELANAEKRFLIAVKNRDDAEKKLNRLNLLVKMSSAAKLAENLSEGEPCPVCGSIHHPKLAISEEIIPTDEEIEIAEKFLKGKESELQLTSNSIEVTKQKINSQEEEIKKLGETIEISDAEKIYFDAKKTAEDLEVCKKRFANGEKVTKQKIEERDKAREFFDTKSKAAENLRGILSAIQKQIPTKYFNNPEKLSEEISLTQKLKIELETAWKIAQDKFHELEKLKSTQEGKIKTEEIAKNDAEKKIIDKQKPDIEELKNSAKNLSENYLKAVSDFAKLEERFNRLKKVSDELEKLSEEILIAEKNHNIWKRLSDVASGKNISKISFQRYYLGVMFQDIVRESNDRLEKMSGGRYIFREMETAKRYKKSAGLDLEIFDAYTGKARPVETLSGGESFIASLSLALGLANVVKNISGGINLDTIFIDEGFGTLDSETLDTAINTLEDLQQGGRLVGIISHVDDLKQRISARLEVKKTKNGSYANFA